MIRLYRESDLEAVTEVFTASVHELGRRYYHAAQLAAWAPIPPDQSTWATRLASLKTLVAEQDMRVAGFISYNQDGHIDLLYVSPLYARRGIASALYRDAESDLCSQGTTEFFTEASKLALSFFEHHNFQVVEEQNVKLRGFTLLRYRMRKTIAVQQRVSGDSP